MGLCPMCGCYIDPGEPCCPDCGFVSLSSQSLMNETGEEIDISEFDEDELEEALKERGYDLYDLEHGLIDEDELEEILDDLR